MNESTILQLSPPEFHGRRAELDRIVSLATASIEGRSRALWIEGPGGIGKSMLLRQAAKELAAWHPTVHCVGPVDMDDTDYRVASNLGLAIADQLGAEHFSRYIETNRKYQRKEIEKVDQDTVLMHLQSGDRDFAADYARFAQGRRVVLLADTLEAILDTHLWFYLMRVIATLPNTLFVLAGRPASGAQRERTLERLRRMPLIGDQGVERIDLVGWPKAEARAFVRRTALGRQLPKSWVENLLYLSRCQPLHLTLALESLQNGKMRILEREVAEVAALAPLYQAERPDKQPVQDDELEALPPEVSFEDLDESGKALCKDFERGLLQKYAAPGPQAEAIRRLTHVRRRLNQAMYQQVMAFEPQVQDPLPWETLLEQPWVRQRAGGYVTLHDIVSELIGRHVWPVRDPKGDERRRLSQQTLGIYDAEIAAQQARFEALNAEFAHKAAKLADAQVDESLGLTETLREVLEIDRQLLVLQAERLYYQLDADLQAGYRTFIEQFDRAGRDSRLALREMLVLEIEDFANQFPVGSAEYYAIRQREAQAAIDEGGVDMIARAEQFLAELLAHYTSPTQQYELLKLQANASMRLPRRTDQVLAILEQALALTGKHGELEGCQGEALMEIGWAQRQLGRWKEAAERYMEARSVVPLDKPGLRARIENGLAYVEALLGKYVGAETLIHSALATRRRWGTRQDVGISLSVLGEVYRYQKKFTQARQAYAEALAIFEEEQNSAWIGQVRQQMAIALLQEDPEANLQEARYYIDSARYLCQEYNARAYPSALNRAGRIYAQAGDYERAFELFREGIERAQLLKDDWFLMANCIEHAELAYRRWEETDESHFRDEIFQDRETIEAAQFKEDAFLDLFGRWHLVQGHVAWREGLLSSQTERWQEALEQYRAGFALIVEGFRGSHGLGDLPRESQILKEHIQALPPSEARRWCKELNKAWGEQKRTIVLLGLISEIYDELVAAI